METWKISWFIQCKYHVVIFLLHFFFGSGFPNRLKCMTLIFCYKAGERGTVSQEENGVSTAAPLAATKQTLDISGNDVSPISSIKLNLPAAEALAPATISCPREGAPLTAPLASTKMGSKPATTLSTAPTSFPFSATGTSGAPFPASRSAVTAITRSATPFFYGSGATPAPISAASLRFSGGGGAFFTL